MRVVTPVHEAYGDDKNDEKKKGVGGPCDKREEKTASAAVATDNII